MIRGTVALLMGSFCALAVATNALAAVEGRYVRLERPPRSLMDVSNRSISISELEVISGDRNLAHGSKVTTSQKIPMPAGNVVNGNTDGNLDFVHFDGRAKTPWIEIDLGQSAAIDRIVLWPRAKSGPETGGVVLVVLDDRRQIVWHQRYNYGRPGVMTAVPTADRGPFVGQTLAPDASDWYDLNKEDAHSRDDWADASLVPLVKTSELPRLELDPEKMQIHAFALGQPADANQRQNRFAQRNSDQGLAELCDQLRRRLRPDAIGTAKFEEHLQKGEYREALDAYRDFFFDRLAHLEKFKISRHTLLSVQLDTGGAKAILRQPSEFALTHIHRGKIAHTLDSDILVADVGSPGSVNWAPQELQLPGGAEYGRTPNTHAFWKTAEGKAFRAKAELCRAINKPVGVFSGAMGIRALLDAYVATGEKRHLELYNAYMDDWAMHARGDIDRCPIDVRTATELDAGALTSHLSLLRVSLDHRPALAREYDSASLARYVMRLVDDLPPYTIRAKRAELANWGIMGIGCLQHATDLLPEFKVMDYYRREAWRLWNINFIQHRSLCGENSEAWDEGHNPIDVEYALVSVPIVQLPAEADALAQREFWDLVKVVERSLLTHLSPSGQYWPHWVRGPWLRHTWQGQAYPTKNLVTARYLHFNSLGTSEIGHILDEPGTLARVQTILGGGTPGSAGAPDRTSDIAPYAAMYYLRDSWQSGAEYFYLQNYTQRSQINAVRDIAKQNRLAGCPRTAYALVSDGRVVIEANSIAVDRKPDNRWQGAIRTGGKTDFHVPPVRNVVDTRFHSSDRFDLAEARQDAPYSRSGSERGDWYGLYESIPPGFDNSPVTDVTGYRQVFKLKGLGLTIIADRMENKSGKAHEWSQFLTLPVIVEEAKFEDDLTRLINAHHEPIQLDATNQSIRTANPGVDNVSVYFVGPKMEFANRLNSKAMHETIGQSPYQVMSEKLRQLKANGLTAPNLVREVILDTCKRPLSARWTAPGNQSLVTVICTRPTQHELPRLLDGDLTDMQPVAGATGINGFAARTRHGARVWFQTSNQRANKLNPGPVTAEAEAVLVVEHEGKTTGIALGATSFAVGKTKFSPASSSFEFAISADGKLTTLPIHTPIDTVQISPAQNVFVDRVEVSFSIPTQNNSDVELRYTLDGSDPTIESNLYTAPFPLEQTAMVKVRPFRKGLKHTPWHFNGTDSGKTITTIFRKTPLLHADKSVNVSQLTAGTTCEYFEGDWPTLFAYTGEAGVLTPAARADCARLLDPSEIDALRKTDMAFGLRYQGYIDVPESGVYAIHAPQHLFDTTMDAGFDLQVWIDEKHWFPAPRLHSENTWFVALEKGLHRLRVSYVDYRYKTFRSEYWMSWRPEQMWQGVPVLEVTPPAGQRQPLPEAWLRRSAR